MIKGIGIDIIDKTRFRKLKNSKEFTHQFLTREEVTRVQRVKAKIRYLTMVFSIKEAVLKALKIGLHRGSYWHDISVNETFNVNLSGFPEVLSKDMKKLFVSKTCSGKYTLSFVLAQE